MLHQDSLDALVEAWTRTQDRYDCMMALQRAGVPAGVCQNAEDRCDHDPQLRHLKWLTEVTGTKIGTWPIYELPMKFSRTPAYIGGPTNRGAPCYGEDNEWVLTELLGMSRGDVERLAEEGVSKLRCHCEERRVEAISVKPRAQCWTEIAASLRSSRG